MNSSRIVKFHGTQAWGIRGEDYFNGESGSISFPIGKYITGKVNYLVLALDNDNIESWRNRDKVTFEDIRLVEASLNEK